MELFPPDADLSPSLSLSSLSLGLFLLLVLHDKIILSEGFSERDSSHGHGHGECSHGSCEHEGAPEKNSC